VQGRGALQHGRRHQRCWIPTISGEDLMPTLLPLAANAWGTWSEADGMSVALRFRIMKLGHITTFRFRNLLASAALLVLVFYAHSARAAEQADPNEWIGLEFSPLLFIHSTEHAERLHCEGESPSVLEAGALGVLRLARRNGARYYWTPVEFGYGGFKNKGDSLLGFTATELGFRFKLSSGGSVELGSALGYGALMLGSPDNCGESLLVGGSDFFLSPVVRWVAEPRGRFTGGLVARAFVPLGPIKDTRPIPSYGVGITFGVEIAVR
jgi:hypothetical protein